VRLTPHTTLPAPARDERLLGEVVKKAFSQRRKTVRNALSVFAAAEDLSALGIDTRLRPEDLTLEEFVRVANAVAVRED
jgi:16S rRNA (adenine1518-N6/adenine1519-N6)-dimethyltransferase